MAYKCIYCRQWNSDCRVKDGVDRRCAGRRESDERLERQRQERANACTCPNVAPGWNGDPELQPDRPVNPMCGYHGDAA